MLYVLDDLGELVYGAHTESDGTDPFTVQNAHVGENDMRAEFGLSYSKAGGHLRAKIHVDLGSFPIGE